MHPSYCRSRPAGQRPAGRPTRWAVICHVCCYALLAGTAWSGFHHEAIAGAAYLGLATLAARALR